MKKSILSGLMAVSICATGFSQTIAPLWEHLATETTPLPILKAQSAPSENDTFDGLALFDSYGGFKRYDDTRLLLGVRENGINENDPNHDAALAAAYPDRSIIWINPIDGSPMGVALDVDAAPVPLSEDFLSLGGTVADFYFNFGVDAAGVIYVNYKNHILRYEPDTNGGFNGPTIAFTMENNASANWHQWRWENIKVTGSGTSTVILAGAKTWRPTQGYYYLTTTNGMTYSVSGFVPNGYGAASGGGSKPVTRDGEEWIFVSSYPGSDAGTGTTFYRFFRTAGTSDDFSIDSELFTAEKNGDAPFSEYRTEFISDVDTDQDLNWVVAYSTPSWNTLGISRTEFSPGFLALHDTDGLYLSSHTIDIIEDVELYSTGTPVSIFHGALGSVEVNASRGTNADSAEILWYSGIYGYGRYAVGSLIADTPPALVNDWAIF